MAVYKPTHTDKKNQQDEHSGKGKGGSSILRKKVAQITFIGYLLSTVVLAGAESEAKKLETYIRDNFGIPGNQTSWFKSIKAIRIDSKFKVESLRSFGNRMFLLDTATPHQFGGTGQTFDWNQVYGANAFGSIIIAGGLNPDNIEGAVSTLHPFAVDVSSGVEAAPGKKSYDKMRRFIEAVRRVDVALLGES